MIAAVVAGLILGHKAPMIQTARSRLNERTSWGTIQFLLENSVFLLIGLQAHWIVEGVAESELPLSTIVGLCLAVLAAVIVLRLVWVSTASFLLFKRDGDNDRPQGAWTLIIGWAGMRGVVTLAVAFLLPEQTEHREVLLLVAMVVTAGTLLLQGLTLPWLSRRMGLRGPDPREDALQSATVLQYSTAVALARLEEVKKPTDSSKTLDLLRERIMARPNAIWERLGTRGELETPSEEYRRLRLETLQAERDEVLRIRSSGKVDHEVIDQVLSTLDVEESMLAAIVERSQSVRDDVVLKAPVSQTETCEHLDAAPTLMTPVGAGACLDCEREGARPVHLRLCLACGNVGCCDSSVGQHAESHFATTGHPVMRSFEAGEKWRWCYLDNKLG